MRLFVAVALALLAIFFFDMLFRYFWHKKLEVTIGFDRDMIYEGEDNVLREVITNAKYLPLPILQVKFSITKTFLFDREENTSVTDFYYRNEFYTVMPFQKITRQYPFICSHRGFYRMNRMDVICRSAFMDKKMIMPLEHEAYVCVLPAKLRPHEVPTKVTNLLGEIEKNVHLNDDPFTFSGIRDYQPYDSMHSINQKATARLGSLQVNTYNTTFSKSIVLLLNLEINSMMWVEQMQEWLIRIASYLTTYFITHQIPVALYTNGVDIIDKVSPSVQAGADLTHIKTIEVALARLDTKHKPDSFVSLLKERVVEQKEQVEYLIISNARKKEIVDTYKSLKKSGHNLHLIIPELEPLKIEDEFYSDEYTAWMVTHEDKDLFNYSRCD